MKYCRSKYILLLKYSVQEAGHLPKKQKTNAWLFKIWNEFVLVLIKKNIRTEETQAEGTGA